ncbi:MAG: hypothetical protein DRI44_06400 [Chlamydiae bacterium]|nr:MAG: hypothetical protein DRI44_06400 [Chlamydiota bacterium]
MNAKNEKRRTKPSGFTLIELLVVITIIAILGAVVAPRLLKNPEKARLAAASADVRSIQLQADSYQLDKGKPISSLQDLVTAGYLEELPVDPWGGDYTVEQRDGDVKIRCANLDAKKQSGVSKVDIDISK